MTIFYAASTNGFYDSAINKEIPTDAVEISVDKWQSLLAAQGNGKIIKSDKNGYPIAVDFVAPVTNDSCNDAAKNFLNSGAKSWGYDSILSAVSYVTSTIPQYKAEGQALSDWRDAVWFKTYTIEAGKLPKTIDAFLALLPAMPQKPVI